MIENKDNWMIYKVDGFDPLTLTESNERTIKEILFELHNPETVIHCHDYLSGDLYESLTLNDLYGEKQDN